MRRNRPNGLEGVHVPSTHQVHVPISLAATAAQQVLDDALAIAQSDQPLPDRWMRAVAAVESSTSKTYVAAFGTALLARATDDRIDPMSIKATPDRVDAYSARSLCHGVLVPFSRANRFDLGATGREPLNNQPFFRYERMDVMERVRDQKGLKVLLAAIREVARADASEARAGVAAFLRSRLAAAAAQVTTDIRDVGLTPRQLVTAAETFLLEGAEGGKRAQALTAAAFDMVFDEVDMGRINDPSRHAAGDVQVFRAARLLLAVEVRQKVVRLDEVVDFARIVQASGHARGLVVAVAAEQPALPRDAARRQCEEQYGVAMTVIDSVAELFDAALTWTSWPVAEAVPLFAHGAAGRLREIEAAPASLERWRELCELR